MSDSYSGDMKELKGWREPEVGDRLGVQIDGQVMEVVVTDIYKSGKFTVQEVFCEDEGCPQKGEKHYCRSKVR